jgi:hypothetical protein
MCVIQTVRTTDCVEPTTAHRRPIASALLRREALAFASTRIDSHAAMLECEDVEAQMERLEDVQLGMPVSKTTAVVEWAVLHWESV